MSFLDDDLDDDLDGFGSFGADTDIFAEDTSVVKSFNSSSDVVDEDDDMFSNSFNENSGSVVNDFTSDEEKSKTRKYAIFCVILGLLIIILVALVVRAISVKNSKKTAENSQLTQEIQISQQEQVATQPVEQTVPQIINEGEEKLPAQQAVEELTAANQQTETVLEAQVPVENENKTVVINNGASEVKPNTKIVNDSDWLQFDKADELVLSTDYTALTYTVTEIEHYARKVDVNNNMELKTMLKGSLSGFGGTYELEVPYSIGSNLKVGNSFNVSVRLGSYNGVSVVDEIAY